MGIVIEAEPDSPIVLSDKTTMLRKLAPSMSQWLESIDKLAKDRLQECLDRFPATSKNIFPFSTEGTGERVESHLKQEGYNWVHIEDIFPTLEQPLLGELGYSAGIVGGYSKLSVKRRLNALHPQMKVKGLRTYQSATPVQFFADDSGKHEIKWDTTFNVGTLKYDIEGITPNEQESQHRTQIKEGDNLAERVIIDSVEEPMFFLIGPSVTALYHKGDDGQYITKRDEKGMLIGYEQRELTPDDFLLLAIPHTKKKPFVVNQTKQPKGSSVSAYSHIALTMKDADWGLDRNWGTSLLPHRLFQKYGNRNWDAWIEGHKDLDIPIKRYWGQDYYNYEKSIAGHILQHNLNYNEVHMDNDTYPTINKKKNQFDLISHRGKIYSGIGEYGMVSWGSDGHGNSMVLYGIMMKDDKAERELRLKELGLGIVNHSNVLE